MSFAAPWFLLALALVPLGLLAYAMGERRTAAGRAAFVSPNLLASVAPRRPGWRRHVPVLVLALAVAALVVALARRSRRPARGRHHHEGRRQGRP